MRTIEDLWEGYRRFRSERYYVDKGRWESLAQGQSPGTMIIGCADSRVDPSVIFSAVPGELFIVRNVANLVPPFDDSGGYHGTSAAIEFATNGLRVNNIVVMGHEACGGIAACLSAHHAAPVGRFIAPWVEIASPARDAVITAHKDADLNTQQRALEWESIKNSITNLMTFPFIAEAVDQGRLSLHGAWFSIKIGELYWLEPRAGDFKRIVASSKPPM